MTREEAITGCLLGTAVADAVGLACDTEHTCLVASALIESARDPDRSRRSRPACRSCR